MYSVDSSVCVCVCVCARTRAHVCVCVCIEPQIFLHDSAVNVVQTVVC